MDYRKLITTLFISLCLGFSASAADLQEDDKELHAQASAGISMVSYGAFRAAKFGKFSSSLMSFTLAMAVGHIKETNDPFYDSKDMEANAVGAVAGVLIPVSFTF